MIKRYKLDYAYGILYKIPLDLYRGYLVDKNAVKNANYCDLTPARKFEKNYMKYSLNWRKIESLNVVEGKEFSLEESTSEEIAPKQREIHP